MLETVLAKFLTKYLNDYIETLDKSQMDMEIWNGRATLENLKLLPSALSHHQLPFRIIKGTIKYVHITFPWKKLSTEACIVEVEDVFILMEIDPEVLIQSDIQAQQKVIHTENQEISQEEETGTWQSLINTVFDNIRVSIKNIHCRLELKYKNGAYLPIGLIIPELSLFTVDENNEPLLNVVTKAAKIRKRLKLNNISVYFDTINSTKDIDLLKPIDIQNFENEMRIIMNLDYHQYLLNPFYMEIFLIHNRNVPNVLQNIASIITHQLKFSMDFSQSQAFLFFNDKWKFFNKRRHFASCARPNFHKNLKKSEVSKEKIINIDLLKKKKKKEKNPNEEENIEIEFWKYYHRCAVYKNRPNEFKPTLALAILKHRKKYIKIFRSWETQSNILHPILDTQLKTLDNKIGPNASLFCRQYAQAVVQKELNINKSGLTAFDITELKSLLQTTDSFFKSDSFSIELSIPSFQVELLYEKNNPFLVVEFSDIGASIESVKNKVSVGFSILNLEMFSVVDQVKRSIVYVEKPDQQFFSVDVLYPLTLEPFQMNVKIEPTITIIDTTTINKIADFFEEQTIELSINSLDEVMDAKNDIVHIYDVATILQNLLMFKNHNINIQIKQLKYVFPVHLENSCYSANFAIKNIIINKIVKEIIPSDAQDINMDFKIGFIIDDFIIDNYCILKQLMISIPFSFKFSTITEYVIFTLHFNLDQILIFLDETSIKLINSLLAFSKNIRFNDINESQKKIKIGNYSSNSLYSNKKTILSFYKLTSEISIQIDKISFLFYDKYSLELITASGSIKALKGAIDGLINLKNISLIEGSDSVIKLPEDSSKIIISRKNEEKRMNLHFEIDDFLMELNLIKLKIIYYDLIKLYNIFLNEDVNSTSTHNEITLENNDENSNKSSNSYFDTIFEIKNLDLIIPDKNGNYLIAIKKILIKDLIEIEDFGAFREGRILIKPMNITLFFDQLSNMKLKHIDSQFEPTDLWAILRLIDDIRFFLKEPVKETSLQMSKSNDSISEKGSLFTISFESSRFEFFHFDKNVLIAHSDEVKIEVELFEDKINTTITINNFNANQFINNKVYKFIEFNEPVICKYQSDGKFDYYNMKFPIATAYFTNEDFNFIFRWIPDDGELNESELKEEDSKSYYTFESDLIHVVMMKGPEMIGYLKCENLNVGLTWKGNSRVFFELTIEKINGFTNLLSFPECTTDFHFIEIPHGIYIMYHNDLFIFKVKKVIASVNITYLLKLIDTLVEILTDPYDDGSKHLFTFGFQIYANEIIANLYPLELVGPVCHGYIKEAKVVLKCQQKLSGISIESIKVDVENATPYNALMITNISGTVAFNGTKLNSIQFQELSDLEDIEDPEIFSIDSAEVNFSIFDIVLKYSNTAAIAAILSFIPKNFQEDGFIYEQLSAPHISPEFQNENIFGSLYNLQQSIMQKYNFKELKRKAVINLTTQSSNSQVGDNTETNLSAIACINSFSIILYIVDPIATIEFVNLDLNYKDKICIATMKEFHLFPKMDKSNDMIKSNESSNLITFKAEGKKLEMHTAEMEISIDFIFYLNIINIVLHTPLFHIQELVEHSTKTDELYTESYASLPFDFDVIIPHIRITMPTSTTIDKKNSALDAVTLYKEQSSKACDNSNMPLFHIDICGNLHISERELQADISKLSIHFSEQITKEHYIPLFDNFSIRLLRYFDDDNNMFITIKMSSFELKVSAIDLILFKIMASNLSKAYDYLIFWEDPLNNKDEIYDANHSNNGRLKSLTFESDNIKIILCKDNRTSTKYIPLFNIVIPPLSFKLDKHDIADTIEFRISPYIQYYNDITGFWDMIVEPMNLVCKGNLSKNRFELKFSIVSDLNINLPLTAVSQYLTLFNKIKNFDDLINLGNQFVELPNFWIENRLGSNVLFRIGDQNNKNFFSLQHKQKIPIYSIEQNTNIFVDFQGEQVSCSPSFLMFPTFLSSDICAVRKPYKGGIVILFKSPSEILNNLQFNVDIFSRKHDKDQFEYLGTIPPAKRHPITLLIKKPTEFLIIKSNTKTTRRHTILTLSQKITNITNFLMGIQDNTNYGALINISATNEISTGTKLFTIYSPFKLVSYLPFSDILISIDETEYKIPDPISNEGPIDIFLSEKNPTCSIKISINHNKFGPPNRIKMSNYKTPQPIFTDKQSIKIAILFEKDEDNMITTAVLFAPCIIYNKFHNIKLKFFENNECTIIQENDFGIWCPSSFFKAGKLSNVDFIAKKWNNNSIKDDFQLFKLENSFLDIKTPRNDTVFLNNIQEKDFFKIGVRCDVSVLKNMYIVTFSNLITVNNKLDCDISLVPIESYDSKESLNSNNDLFQIKSKCKSVVEEMYSSGIFQLYIQNSINSPYISLITEQRTCIKMINSNGNTNIIELQVIETEMGFKVFFQNCLFPTPVLIENCLSIPVLAYQIDRKHSFFIESHSTSWFAYDEPLEYPALYIDFDSDNEFQSENLQCITKIQIPFKEETEYVKFAMNILENKNLKLENNEIYIAVKRNTQNVLAVIITGKPNEASYCDNSFNIIFNISSVKISLIDLNMREISLITFDKIVFNISSQSNFFVVKSSIDTIQLDDQNISAPKPTVLIGRNYKEKPFFYFESLIPSDVPFFSTFTYVSAVFQRLDVLIDASFVSDFIYLFLGLLKPFDYSIKPLNKIMDDDTSIKNLKQHSDINIKWAEMSPIYIYIGYNRKSGRETSVHKMFPVLNYIPSLSPGNLILPGIIMNNIECVANDIFDNISSEYKTASFNQIIKMLGRTGTLLTTFGITSTIAEVLGVKLKADKSKYGNDLNRSLSINSLQNIKQLISSYQMTNPSILSLILKTNIQKEKAEKTLQESHIESLVPNNITRNIHASLQSLYHLGISLSSVSNHGKLGVITKANIDPQNQIAHMGLTKRRRVPRAFLNNRIEIFNKRLSQAQNCINRLKKGRIRMSGMIDENLTVLTDRFIIVLNQNCDNIIFQYDIMNLQKLNYENNCVMFFAKEMKKDETMKTIVCSSQENATIMNSFLQSQRLMLLTFNTSLIE